MGGVAELICGRLAMAGPLEGVKVVEFTEIIAGPFAGMLLADMGAEVIKVEPPWGDPWRGDAAVQRDGEPAVHRL